MYKDTKRAERRAQAVRRRAWALRLVRNVWRWRIDNCAFLTAEEFNLQVCKLANTRSRSTDRYADGTRVVKAVPPRGERAADYVELY